MALPPFFRGVSGGRTNGKQGKCGHACYFCSPRGLQKRLLGSLPKPGFGTRQHKLRYATLGQNVPKSARSVVPPLPTKSYDFAGHPTPKVICLRHRSLSLLFLFALAVRGTQQMVDIGPDRHDLPHFLLCRAVLGIERLFPRRQLAAFSF